MQQASYSVSGAFNELSRRLVVLDNDTEVIEDFLRETMNQVHGFPIGKTGLNHTESTFIECCDTAIDNILNELEVAQ